MTEVEDAVALRPRGRVAAGTPAPEVERLALQENTHPDANPLTIQSMIWLLRAYSGAMAELSEHLRPLELSLSAFNVLQSLINTPGEELEPCELAERLLVSRPSVTGLIDTLEAKGLVYRRRHPDDRRRVLVGPTDKARGVLEQHYPDHYASLEATFEALTLDERDTLVGLLRKIRGAMPSDLAAASKPATK